MVTTPRASRPVWRYFTWSLAFTALGVAGAGLLGYCGPEGSLLDAGRLMFVVCVLAVLEISLSFDNAIVNATVLEDMDEKWVRRFLTWGILIAVFGMRIVFPLLIVAVAAGLGPVQAVNLAVYDPARYASILSGAHVGISAFGGSFLFMVGLRFFFDREKEVHWLGPIERRLTRFASVEGLAIGIVLAAVYAIGRLLGDETASFLAAAICGLVAFIAVEAVGELLGASGAQVDGAARSGAAGFLYLEMLDASFSFDGVIGAFALSNNLFVIAIGLGVGAFYVRSFTLMLVEKGTLAEYRYLEHGAFWAILCLAAVMYAQTLVHVPEVVTGLLGVALIGAALWSSVRHNRAAASAPTPSAPADPAAV